MLVFESYLPDDSSNYEMPRTFREPGVGGKYVFASDVFDTIVALRECISALENHDVARLLKVLLGSVLVYCSNVIVNGKGRKYRRQWELERKSPSTVIDSLDGAVDRAVADLIGYSARRASRWDVYCGDARTSLDQVGQADVAVFSPPYPNSFDYTDIYNIELWMLGYLESSSDNRNLRFNTLRSHVQIRWANDSLAVSSPALKRTFAALEMRQSHLWNKDLPKMIVYYFSDLRKIFTQLGRILPKGHHAAVVIGDSQYAGIRINVAEILAEVVGEVGFTLVESAPIRSMRCSPQHGGKFELSEHCMVFANSR